MNYKLLWPALLLRILVGCHSYAQEYRVQTLFAPTGDCRNAPELIICHSGVIWPYSRDSVWWFSGNSQCFKSSQPKSNEFWIRVVIERDATMELKITSENSSQLHNFTLYRSPGTDNFCDRVMKRAIVPVRTTMFNEDINNGVTGLTSTSNSDPTTDEPSLEALRKKPYQQAMPVKAGEIYYLVVHSKSAKSDGYAVSISIPGSSGLLKVLPLEKLNMIPKSKPSIPIDLAYREFCSRMESIESAPTIQPIVREEKFGSLKAELQIQGYVTDSITGKPIVANLFRVEDNRETLIGEGSSSGEYSVGLSGTNVYEILVSALGYQPKKVKVMRTQFSSAPQTMNVSLCPHKPGEKFVLNHIYFYAGTYAFTNESSESLEDLLSYMTGHPSLKIEISGHTNGKGRVKKKKSHAHLGPEWNFSGNEKKLSKLRADALRQYLLSNGIEPGRIETAGYGGEQMLYTKPSNKKERDMNKRVEIKILSN